MVKFSKEADSEFFHTLRSRVNTYFKSQGISPYGNYRMVIKTICMLLMYFGPYGILMSGTVSNPWIFYGLWIIMGFGVSGIGLSIMHDANHGSYSKNKRVNKYLGLFLNVIGGSAQNWKIQHNKLHHSFTNIDGMDQDINSPGILRFSPHQKRRGFHRFQHLYVWFLYGLSTIMWITSKDFVELARYRRKGLIRPDAYKQALKELVLWKVLYYAYIVVLPIVVLPVPVWMTITAFLLMHFVSGLTLTSIFQAAHVMPTSEYPLPNEEGIMEDSWAAHQLKTTTNFAPSSKFLNWYAGGLNYQIEHHLFPNVCHVHYRKISKIVSETAEQYGLPYHFKKTFPSALWDHTKMLRMLGKHDDMAAGNAQTRAA